MTLPIQSRKLTEKYTRPTLRLDVLSPADWTATAPATIMGSLDATASPERSSDQEPDMKKLKHEAELFKGALLAGVKYAEGRKAVEFEPTDSASQKLLYIYRLLVHDKLIQPLPEDQVAEASMRHKLAIWYSKQLPKDHPLLN
jgi:hypothetical protein